LPRTEGSGRKRRWETPQALLEAWIEYKEYCDTRTVTQTMFSQKDGKFYSQDVPHPITYTVKGFCVYHGMTESNFYMTYADDEEVELKSVIACMKEECEIDARQKFENGTLDSRLAGLWMSNHGYTTNVDQKVDADMSLNVKVDYGDE